MIVPVLRAVFGAALLAIDSADGSGTTVTLRFPAARVLSGQVASDPKRPANDPDTAAATATIHRLTPRTAAPRG